MNLSIRLVTPRNHEANTIISNISSLSLIVFADIAPHTDDVVNNNISSQKRLQDA